MGVGHDQSMAADSSDSATLGRATIDGYTLADDVLVANLDAASFTAEAQILRFDADGAKRKKTVTRADLCRAVDDNMRNQLTALAQFHICADDTIRAYRTRHRNLCRWINDCGGVDHWNWVI